MKRHNCRSEIEGLRSLLVVIQTLLAILLLSWSVAGQQVQLTIMAFEAAPWLAFHEKAIAEYEAANPNVKIELVPGDVTKLQVSLAGGVKVDLFYHAGGVFNIPAHAGMLKSLDPLIAKDASFDLDDFFPNAVNAHRVDGAVYGLPQVVSPAVLITNRDLFDQAAVSYPSDWTWNDLVTQGKKLTRDTNGDGQYDQYALSYQNFAHYNRWPIWVWAGGGKIFSEDGRRVVLNDPKSVEALQFYVDLGLVHRIAPLPEDPILEGTNYTDLFNNQQAAMIPQTRYYQPPADMNWNLAHIPRGEQRSTTLITNFYGILEETRYPDEAWDFMKYLLKEAAQKRLLDDAYPAVPAYIPNARQLIDADRDLPNQMLWIDAMNYARGPVYPPIQTWSSIVSEHFGRLSRGEISVQALAEAITADANAALDEYYSTQSNR